jgi:hypothetical protein
MENQSFCADTTRRARPSLSYDVYNFSNSSPQESDSPGASWGQNSDQEPLLSTRCDAQTRARDGWARAGEDTTTTTTTTTTNNNNNNNNNAHLHEQVRDPQRVEQVTGSHFLGAVVLLELKEV